MESKLSLSKVPVSKVWDSNCRGSQMKFNWQFFVNDVPLDSWVVCDPCCRQTQMSTALVLSLRKFELLLLSAPLGYDIAAGVLTATDFVWPPSCLNRRLKAAQRFLE